MVEVYLYLFNIHTFIHTIFFGTVGRCKCWMVCFFVFGHRVTCSLIVNCFWKIRVALKRAGFGATCAGLSTDLG